MSVSLKDIASKAGCSVSTVSMVLNGRADRYRATTRHAILEAAKDLRYRPDMLARQFRRAGTRRNAIGFLVEHGSDNRLNNTPSYEFICGINDVLLHRDQFMVLVQMGQLHVTDDPVSQPRLISERFIDGLIVESGVPTLLEQEIREYRIPTIWLNTAHHEAEDCVYPDEIHAGRTVTQALLEAGHRHIAFVVADAPDTISSPRPGLRAAHFSCEDRYSGYAEALAERGLPPLRLGCGPGGHADPTVQAVRRSWETDSPITALACQSFANGLAIEHALSEVGLRCPRDVSIVSAEDVFEMRRNWPRMTGITCDRYRMGRHAAEMALEKVQTNGRPIPSFVSRGTFIPGTTVAPAAR